MKKVKSRRRFVGTRKGAMRMLRQHALNHYRFDDLVKTLESVDWGMGLLAMIDPDLAKVRATYRRMAAQAKEV